MVLVLFGYLGTSPDDAVRNLTTAASEFTTSEMSYYQRLADAFLSGRAYLTERPPEWLLTAPNPYEPEVSAPVRVYGISDAILFDDKFWYYWPPGVVAFLVAPLLAIGVQIGELQVGFLGLVTLAACGVDAAMILQWSRGARRIFSILFALAIGLPFSALFLAPRMAIWESNILAAAALAAVALQCFVRIWAAIPGSSRRTLVIGCIAGSLATTVRPEAAIVFIVPLAQALIGQVLPIKLPPIKWRALSLLSLALTLGVIFVLTYNALRFGNPLDFKVQYMLTGYENQSELVFSSPQYLLPNSYHYIVRPIEISLIVPILNFEPFRWPFARVLDHSEYEPSVGALWVMPWAFLGAVTLIAYQLLAGVRPRLRKVVDERFALLALVLVMAWIVLIAFLGISIFSATQRYHLLPAVLLGIAGMASFAAIPPLFGSSRLARVSRGLVSVCLVWSTVLALVAGSQGYYPPGSGARAPQETMSGKVVNDVIEVIQGTIP